MRRWRGQRGAGLILLIGITAALAILTSSLVMLLANQQGATARERQSKTSLYYAEAAMNSALAAVKQSDAWRTNPTASSANQAEYAVLTASLGTNYDTLVDPAGPAVTYRIYDDAATITAGTPGWDQNNNTKVWVQVTTTYQGRTSSVRQMVAAKTEVWTARLPKAAAFCGGAGAGDNITMTGTSDVYMASYSSWPATYTNGTPYIGGAPFPTSIMAKGSITGASGSDLAQGTGKSKPQSVGVIYGTSKSFPLLGTSLQSSQGSVPDLNSYLSLSDQVALEQEARSILDADTQALLSSAKVDARPADARPADQRPAAVTTPSYTTKALLLAAMPRVGNTYTATGNMYYNNTSIPLALNDAGITYDFKSLNVRGNVSISGTATVVTKSLRVSGTLSITSTGTTNPNLLGIDASGVVVGSVYVIGNTTIGGSSTNKFGPLWTDGSLTLNGSGVVTSATTLHVGSAGMSISSTTGTNTIGPAYIVGGLTTTSACTSPNRFQDLWVDGTVTLGGSAATTITTLHVGVDLAINSLTGTNTIGPAYVVRNFSTAAASTSPNQFQDLWVDGTATLNGRAATTTTSLHVGGAFSINSTLGANTFASTYVIGAFSTTAASTSANGFGPLWVDGTATLNGSGATTTASLHVGGGFSINSPGITNRFGPTHVIGSFGTTSTSTSTNQFGALWVDPVNGVGGGVTLNGLTTTNTTALHVGGNFVISGPTSTNTFGPVYVIGYVDWGGRASVKTTYYTDAAAAPAPMWIGGMNTSNSLGFNRTGGPYNDEYGDTFIVFRVNWASSGGQSTVICPLFATTEMITTSNAINFGTMVTYPTDPDPNHTTPRPMTLYMVCDNDGFYSQTCTWSSTGQFYGLMILFEAGITLQEGSASGPAVVGSVLTIGGDNGLKLNNLAQIAYCQDVVDWVFFPTVSTSTVTQTVPGTWQELSPSGQ